MIDLSRVPAHHKSVEPRSGWLRDPATGIYYSPLAAAKHRMASGPPSHFTYDRWRHGGWYVAEIRYPNGGCGCVTRNFCDRKWRIACDPRPFDQQPTFHSRDDAARGEWLYVKQLVDSTPF